MSFRSEVRSPAPHRCAPRVLLVLVMLIEWFLMWLWRIFACFYAIRFVLAIGALSLCPLGCACSCDALNDLWYDCLVVMSFSCDSVPLTRLMRISFRNVQCWRVPCSNWRWEHHSSSLSLSFERLFRIPGNQTAIHGYRRSRRQKRHLSWRQRPHPSRRSLALRSSQRGSKWGMAICTWASRCNRSRYSRFIMCSI